MNTATKTTDTVILLETYRQFTDDGNHLSDLVEAVKASGYRQHEPWLALLTGVTRLHDGFSEQGGNGRKLPHLYEIFRLADRWLPQESWRSREQYSPFRLQKAKAEWVYLLDKGWLTKPARDDYKQTSFMKPVSGQATTYVDAARLHAQEADLYRAQKAILRGREANAQPMELLEAICQELFSCPLKRLACILVEKVSPTNTATAEALTGAAQPAPPALAAGLAQHAAGSMPPALGQRKIRFTEPAKHREAPPPVVVVAPPPVLTGSASKPPEFATLEDLQKAGFQGFRPMRIPSSTTPSSTPAASADGTNKKRRVQELAGHSSSGASSQPSSGSLPAPSSSGHLPSASAGTATTPFSFSSTRDTTGPHSALRTTAAAPQRLPSSGRSHPLDAPTAAPALSAHTPRAASTPASSGRLLHPFRTPAPSMMPPAAALQTPAPPASASRSSGSRRTAAATPSHCSHNSAPESGARAPGMHGEVSSRERIVAATPCSSDSANRSPGRTPMHPASRPRVCASEGQGAGAHGATATATVKSRPVAPAPGPDGHAANVADSTRNAGAQQDAAARSRTAVSHTAEQYRTPPPRQALAPLQSAGSAALQPLQYQYHQQQQPPMAAQQQQRPAASAPAPQPARSVNSSAAAARPAYPTPGAPRLARSIFWVNGCEYTALEMVGKGGSAKVYKVRSPEGELRALKVVDLHNEGSVSCHMEEIQLLAQLRGSPHIIHMYDFEVTQEELLVVMELGITDMHSLLTEHLRSRQRRPEAEVFQVTNLIITYWKQMLQGLKEAQAHRIVHADLKLNNFLLVGHTVKLIDFGIAKPLPADQTCLAKPHGYGTPNYMAPEVAHNFIGYTPRQQVTRKADIWSMGVILYLLVYGRCPFDALRDREAKARAILSPKRPIRFFTTDNPAALDLMQRCLTRDVARRISFEDIERHPFVMYTATEPGLPHPSGISVPDLFNLVCEEAAQHGLPVNAVYKEVAARWHAMELFSTDGVLRFIARMAAAAAAAAPADPTPSVVTPPGTNPEPRPTNTPTPPAAAPAPAPAPPPLPPPLPPLARPAAPPPPPPMPASRPASTAAAPPAPPPPAPLVSQDALRAALAGLQQAKPARQGATAAPGAKAPPAGAGAAADLAREAAARAARRGTAAAAAVSQLEAARAQAPRPDVLQQELLQRRSGLRPAAAPPAPAPGTNAGVADAAAPSTPRSKIVRARAVGVGPEAGKENVPLGAGGKAAEGVMAHLAAGIQQMNFGPEDTCMEEPASPFV